MPGKRSALLDGFDQLLRSTSSIGVSQIVQNSNRKFLGFSGGLSGIETQDIGRSGTIRFGDLVVVGGSTAQTLYLDLVEEFTTLSDCSDFRARRGTVVAILVS